MNIEKQIDKITSWLLNSKFKRFYDMYDNSFSHQLIDDNKYCWWEDGSFNRTLVVDIETGAVITFKNISKTHELEWVFEMVHIKETIELHKILNNK